MMRKLLMAAGLLMGPGLANADPAWWLAGLRGQVAVPGLSVAVSRQGQTVWHAQAGWADGARKVPVGADTVFRLASVSKAVCSVIAATLIEQGKLQLESRVGALLPELPGQYHEIRLRDLMTHTSGLPHYQARDALRGRTRYRTATSALEQIGDRSLDSMPGSEYLYSTHGFSLASAMMERATGQSFIELMAEPGQGGIRLESETPRDQRHSRLYDGAGNEIEPEDFSYAWCGAGMESSARDLANYFSTVFAADSPLGASARRLLVEPLPDRHGRAVQAERWVMTLGLRRSTDHRGETYLHHAGVTNGARSIVAVWPESGVAVALLSNASWTGRMEDTAIVFQLAAFGNGQRPECGALVSGRHGGRFADEDIALDLIPIEEGADCAARLRGDNALIGWLGRFNGGVDDGLVLAPLADDDWGLLTPIGLSVLRKEGTGLVGRVGSRTLEIDGVLSR